MLYFVGNYDTSIVQLNTSILDQNKRNISKFIRIYYIYKYFN